MRIEGTGDVVITADITTSGDIYMEADTDNDGEGKFSQNDGEIEVTGSAGIWVDGSGEMVLGTLKTELGAIKVGTVRMPDSVSGEPHYVKTAGDIEIA